MGNLQHWLVVLHGDRWAGVPQMLAGLFPHRMGSRASQDGVVIPHSIFPRDAAAACPSPEAHLKESRAAIFVCHFSMSAAEKKNQPKGLFNCNIKNHAFAREKRRVLHPLSFQCNTVSADSVSFKSKQATHHCEKCHSSERSPQACISPRMFPSPTKPGANY